MTESTEIQAFSKNYNRLLVKCRISCYSNFRQVRRPRSIENLVCIISAYEVVGKSYIMYDQEYGSNYVVEDASSVFDVIERVLCTHICSSLLDHECLLHYKHYWVSQETL